MEPLNHADRQRVRRAAPLVLLLTGLLLPSAVLGQETRAVVDETGRRVEVPARIGRLVSLAPNLTEIVYALGLESRLVGVTAQCDFPLAAQAKAKVGDVVNPSVEKILELKPDLVLATTAGNRRATVEVLERVGIPLYGLDPHDVEGILGSIRHVAELAGVPERGQTLAARLQAQLAAVKTPAGAERPRVLFIIWLEPLITVGNDTFLNDVLRRAGAASATADLEQNWPRLSLEEVVRRDPDYLVLPRSPNLEASLGRAAGKEPWRRLRAVRDNHIVWLDEAVLRPGPRIVEVIAALAGALHPESRRERGANP